MNMNTTLQKTKKQILCLLLSSLVVLPLATHCANVKGTAFSEESIDELRDSVPGLGAIYLWVTGCTVQGDMNGGSSSNPCLDPAGAPANGPKRADAICAARYDDDVDETSRNRIAQEGFPRHTAMLARSPSQPNTNFPVRGRGVSQIKRPDGTTLIAESWEDFFNPEFDIPGNISESSGAGDPYWTGWWVQADLYSPSSSSGRYLYCGPLNSYWTSNTEFNDGITGSSSVRSANRLTSMSATLCSQSRGILCITH